MAEVTELLKQVIIFRDLDDAELAQIAEVSREEKFESGEFIFREGEHGNRAAHDGRVTVNDRASLAVVRELFHILYWVANTYGRDRTELAGLEFDVALIPRPRTAEEKAKAVQLSREKLRQIQEAQRERDEELARLRDTDAQRQAEIEALQAELAAVRKANEQVMHSGNYAYRDRRARKGEFRKLWIMRINAACRQHDISYSRFVAGLKAAEIEVDRKILADLAVRDDAAFGALVTTAREALDAA